MNIRLQNLLQEAETRLDARSQERLSDLVEAFVETAAADEVFSDIELTRLKELDKTPFDAAHATEVAALFGRRA